MRLLGLLRLHGPSTATLLGAQVGESSGTTSYHLRQLAQHGFVEDAGELGNARDRWWRAAHRMTSWARADFADGEGREVAEELERRLVEGRGQRLTAWLDQREQLGESWRTATDLSDWALRLSPEQAKQVVAELNGVVERWAAQHPTTEPAEGTELVSVHLDVFPLREWPA
jgi:DNA-binding transcriptional ArsR family regulator